MSRRIRLLLMGVGIVAVALLVFFLLLNPIRGDIGDLELQVADEQRRIAEAEAALAKADETKAEGRKNQARILELAKLMPVDPEIPSLILQIQDLADKAGIDWIQVTPGAVKDAGVGSYGILPLSLEFSGTYFDVSDFIYRAEQMAAGPGRLLAVKTLSLAPGGAGTGTATTPNLVQQETSLTVSMTMYAFVLPGGLEKVTPPGAEPVTTVPPATTETNP